MVDGAFMTSKAIWKYILSIFNEKLCIVLRINIIHFYGYIGTWAWILSRWQITGLKDEDHKDTLNPCHQHIKTKTECTCMGKIKKLTGKYRNYTYMISVILWCIINTMNWLTSICWLYASFCPSSMPTTQHLSILKDLVLCSYWITTLMTGRCLTHHQSQCGL